MATNIAAVDELAFHREPPPDNEARSSGVSWSAVIGGSFVCSALYLILLALGAGFGLSTISPWPSAGVSAAAAGTAAVLWLIFIEIVASATGGYLTGRLRTKWARVHTDEVYFRDTANGFLAWAVALVVTAAFLASAATSMAGSVAAPVQAENDANSYFADSLFRSDRVESVDPGTQSQAERILANAMTRGQMPAGDQSYLAQIVSAKTGMSQRDAEQRVTNVLTDARQTADAVRAGTAHVLLWLFLSLLMGAFSASYAATLGGRQRDHVKA